MKFFINIFVSLLILSTYNFALATTLEVKCTQTHTIGDGFTYHLVINSDRETQKAMTATVYAFDHKTGKTKIVGVYGVKHINGSSSVNRYIGVGFQLLLPRSTVPPGKPYPAELQIGSVSRAMGCFFPNN